MQFSIQSETKINSQCTYVNRIKVLNQYPQFMNEYLSELESRAEQESSCVKEAALQPTGWKVSNGAQKQWVKHNTEPCETPVFSETVEELQLSNLKDWAPLVRKSEIQFHKKLLSKFGDQIGWNHCNNSRRAVHNSIWTWLFFLSKCQGRM